MSNTAYPIASVHHGHQSRDFWESLPRKDKGVAETMPSRFFIGVFWALVIEVGAGVIGWLLWELFRWAVSGR
jgi:hypothetical protein